MESFGHLFAFLAAINLGSIASSTYLITLEKEFSKKNHEENSRGLSAILFSHAQALLNQIIEQLKEKLKIPHVTDAEKNKFENKKKKFEKRLNDFKESKSENTTQQDTVDISKEVPLKQFSFFNFYSVFSFGYSLCMLILVSFQIHMDSPYGSGALWVLNFSSAITVFVAWRISQKKYVYLVFYQNGNNNDDLSFNPIVKSERVNKVHHFSYLVALFVAVGIVGVCCALKIFDLCWLEWFGLDCHAWMTNFNLVMIITILVPSWHFLLYARRIFLKVRRYSKSNKPELQKLIDAMQKFVQDIHDRFESENFEIDEDNDEEPKVPVTPKQPPRRHRKKKA